MVAAPFNTKRSYQLMQKLKYSPYIHHNQSMFPLLSDLPGFVITASMGAQRGQKSIRTECKLKNDMTAI